MLKYLKLNHNYNKPYCNGEGVTLTIKDMGFASIEGVERGTSLDK